MFHSFALRYRAAMINGLLFCIEHMDDRVVAFAPNRPPIRMLHYMHVSYTKQELR
jgi:hypothetical protein